MTWDPAHARAPLRPQDPHSSPPSLRSQDHKRQRSQTLGTTFVSTTVVPASSSTDVLSSLISSLTILSDSAREQIRSARELEPALTQPDPGASLPEFPSSDVHSEFSISTEQYSNTFDASDGDEAEPPVVGYTRPRTRDQKRSSKERWNNYTAGRDRNLNRSSSSHAMRRPQSGASSYIGMPSIERVPGGSSSSLIVPPSSGTRSPLKMFLSTRYDNESNHSIPSSTRDAENKSVKSFRTTKSKQSTQISQDQEADSHIANHAISTDQSSAFYTAKSTPEHNTYSPLNPANHEDLGERLIPSRRSSMRHSPSLRGSSKGRCPSTGRGSSLRSKSFSAVAVDMPAHGLNEEPFEEEEDSTLRRIRELQQAKEKRHMEWRKESRRSEKSVPRSSRNRSKSAKENNPERSDSPKPAVLEKPESPTPKHLQSAEKLSSDSFSAPVVRDIDIPSPSLNVSGAAPSPVSSTPRRHKRSLSASLRRSSSAKHRPIDDLRSVSDQVEAFLTAPRLTQRIRHPRTGRTVAFSEVGDPAGFAVFCCVGMGLTRYVTSFYDDVARTQKLRLITPDRPGIGESSPFPDSSCTPLAWVDDVAVICQALKIEKFSLLAHSAGSIYALATALKMPDKIRGRIHLLAPWIPPSQFRHGTVNGAVKAVNLPMAHKLLSVLPSPFLKAANSRFLSATSASIDPRSAKGRRKDQSISATYDSLLAEMAADIQPMSFTSDRTSPRHSSVSHPASTPTSTPPPYRYQHGIATPPHSPSPTHMRRQFSISASKLRSPTPVEASMSLTPQARQALLDQELTYRTWALATLNANPAVDLLVCLERRRPIGFKYTDVTRGVVIHHGRKDARVPLENVQWLSQAMKRSELRILDDEGHGLMASASVMSLVLAEVGREWEEWDVIAKENEKRRREAELEQERMKEVERRRFIRQGH